jgi:hypothetical protein
MTLQIDELILDAHKYIDKSNLSSRLRFEYNYELIVGAIYKAVEELDFRLYSYHKTGDEPNYLSLEETIDNLYRRYRYRFELLELSAHWKNSKDYEDNRDAYLFNEFYSIVYDKIKSFDEDEKHFEWIPF